jgi:aryl-alcohol dehydrogenase-like predicted oxidoreductase
VNWRDVDVVDRDLESMERRNFGTTGLTSSALGMGCSRLGSFLSAGGRREAVATINLAVERGINFFDTSDIYAQGDSERYLGTALVDKRDRVILATKAGRRFSNRARIAARLKAPIRIAMRLLPALQGRVRAARAEHISFDFSPDYLTTALEASLKRLRTDWVDVFMLHAPPADVLTDEDLFYRLGRLKEQGKVRCLGVSVAEIAHARLAASLPGVRAIQLPIGRPQRAELGKLLPELAAQGVAVVGREVFEGVDRTMGQSSYNMALCEALGISGVAVVLAGMSNRYHLEANLAELV